MEYPAYNPFALNRERIADIESLELPGEPRAHLQAIRAEHADAFSAFIAEEADHLAAYLPWAFDKLGAASRLRQYIEQIQENQRLAFFIFEGTPRRPGQLLGFVGLANPIEERAPCVRSAKLGVYVAKHAQGYNYTYRGLQTLLYYAEKQWQLTRAVLEIGKTNTRSKNLATKLGAVFACSLPPIRVNPHNVHRRSAFHYRSLDHDTEMGDTTYDGQPPRDIPMEEWRLGLPATAEKRRALQEGRVHTYRSAVGAIALQNFNQVSFNEKLDEDIRICQKVTLGSELFASPAGLKFLPAIQSALKRDATVTFNVVQRYRSYEHPEETKQVIATLGAETGLTINDSDYETPIACINDNIVWGNSGESDYKRIETRRPYQDYTDNPNMLTFRVF